MSPAPSNYSTIKGKTGDGSLKKENRPRDLRKKVRGEN